MASAEQVMVTMVREAKGWTQKNLADASGVSQGYLSKVENGLLDLTGERLEQVARALDCPISIFGQREPIGGLSVTCLHHRRRQSTMTVGAVKRIEAMAHLTRLTTDGLLTGIEVPVTRTLRRGDERSPAVPAETAQALRTEWELGTGPIENLIDVLESAGVVVVIRKLGSNSQDAVSMWPADYRRAPLMVINDGFTPDRQRFTTAHELAHLILHPFPAEQQELEANQFAAEFLTPAALIRPELEGLRTHEFRRLMELKSEWGVSIGMLIQRAKDLECISDRQFKEFRIRLSRMGWNISEPVEVPRETPTLLDRAIRTWLEQPGSSLEQVASMAQMTPASFVRHYFPAAAETQNTDLRLVT